MNTETDIVEFMQNPENYDDSTTKVEHKQTHISHVFLTKDFVYKVKKPVNFGFLDFETLEKRKFYCEEEVRLNKRLCPELYLGVIPITNDNGLSLNGSGKTVEYAVKMKRMPEETIMKHLLKNDKVSYKEIKKIANILSEFYKNVNCSENIDNYGKPEMLKQATDQNFEQTEKYVDYIFDGQSYEFIKNATNRFFIKNKELFEIRIKNSKIKEGHGDLHSGNIFIHNGQVCIFDCVEFNKSFRCGDVANDIAFLAMDLEYFNKCNLAKYLIQKYVDFTHDYNIYALLDFYKCYRAYVRAKVTAFLTEDKSLSAQKKEELKEEAKNYFQHAYEYAQIFDNQTPAVIISCGVTATGKSRWLKVASDIINAPVLRTDEIRKELFNMREDEKRDENFYKRYYSEASRQMVYDEIFTRAEKIVKNGGKLAIDATFIKAQNRKIAKELADKYGAEFIIIHTRANEETIKKRLEQRKKEKNNVSDANIDAYIYQSKNFEEPDEGKVITLNTEKEDMENIKKLRAELGKIFHIRLRNGN
ncbi:MAG: AAA family ATPase [Candidatus Nanoarchaeia archaeon]